MAGVLALGNVPLGDAGGELALAVLALHVVRVGGRRGRGQVLGVSPVLNVVLHVLGVLDGLHELLVLVPPVTFLRKTCLFDKIIKKSELLINNKYNLSNVHKLSLDFLLTQTFFCSYIKYIYGLTSTS